MVTAKRAPGRPRIEYSPKYHPLWARSLCRRGATFDEVAAEFGIGRTTLRRWVDADEGLKDAMDEGKGPADALVEASLFKRATGYEYEEVKGYKTHDGRSRVEKTTKHVVPDTTACIFWLKNRRPDLWRDVQRQELTGPDGTPLQLPDISVVFVDGEEDAGKAD